MNYIYLCMSLIKPTDKVLDIGGASQPFRRANSVIDFKGYDYRSESSAYFQGMPAHYSKDTWIAQDICDYTKPWPFKDKEFDFAVCAQTLEDVRDPLWVCHEMQRVAKRGFIETPTRFYEQIRGFQYPGLSGAVHHRWLVTERHGDLVFTFKSHDVHLDKYQLKPPFFNKRPFLNPNYEALGIFWNDWFRVFEDVQGAIDGNELFFKETKRLAEQLGVTLWNQSAKLPTEISPLSFSGIRDVLYMEKPGGRHINPYTIDRKRSKESLDYEAELLNAETEWSKSLL